MESLGDDLLQRIFSKMPATSLGTSSSACGYWHNLIEANPALWERAYLTLTHGSKGPVDDLKVSEASNQSQRQLVNKWKTYAVAEEQRLRFANGSVTLQKWKGHSGRVTCCGMLRDRVATGSSDSIVHIWSVKSLSSLEEYTVPSEASVVDLNFDETRVVAAAGAEVFIWSRGDKGRLLKRMSSQNQRLHSLSVCDPELVVGCGDGTSRVFDIYSGRCSRIFRQHTGAVTCLGMDNSSPQLLASGSDAGKVVLTDMVYGQQVASMTPEMSHAGVTCLQITPSARHLICGTTSGTAHCLDLRTHKELWATKVSTTQVTCMHQQIYGGSVLVTGGVDGVLRVLSSETGELLQSYKRTQFDGPIRLATTESTERAACPRQNTGQVKLTNPPHQDIKYKTGPAIVTRQIQSAPPVLSVKMGLTRAITTHTDGSMTLWQFEKNMEGP